MDIKKKIQAIKVHQWLEAWEKYEFDPKEHRSKPEPYFLIFSMNANELRALSGIYPRTTKDGLQRSQDLGIQRMHDPERSKKSMNSFNLVTLGQRLADLKGKQENMTIYVSRGGFPLQLW